MSITEILVHVLLFISLYFEVYLLMAFLEKGRNTKPKKEITVFPNVTIIVPCYNEQASIGRTITSLLALEYPKEKLQIILVDDGSTDNTRATLKTFTDDERVLGIFNDENHGKHYALNCGIAKATGEIIGCLDSDSTVDPKALIEIVRTFQEEPDLKAVTPAIRVVEPEVLLQYVQKAEYSLAIFLRRALSMIDGAFVTPGPFSFFRKEVFTELGPYREAYNTEDLEIALRMQSKRYRIGNSPDAHVFTRTPRTLPALLRQRVRWVYGFIKNFFDYRYMVLRPKYGNVGMLVLPIAFVSIFSALFLFSLMVTRAASTAAKEVGRIDTIGFYASLPSTEGLNWFYLYTESVLFLMGTLVALTFALILIGKRMAGDNRVFTGDVLVYFLFYGFIAPLWLARAVWRAAWSKKPVWTEERKAK